MLAVGSAAGAAAWAVYTAGDRAALPLLRSPDPAVRQRGAWLVAEHRAPNALALVTRQLALQAEPDARVREAYAFALGRRGRPESYETLGLLTLDEPDGRVRAMAWLSMARCDPARFRVQALALSRPAERWDRIGIAYGLLEGACVERVADLFEAIHEGDWPQRDFAESALAHTLVPLLEAAGRWPLEADSEAIPWPEALVAEVERRAAELPLAAIAADTQRLWPLAAHVRRNVGRLTGARERIVWFLLRQ